MQVRRAAEGIDLVAAVPAAFEAPGDEGAQMFKRFLGLGFRVQVTKDVTPTNGESTGEEDGE